MSKLRQSEIARLLLVFAIAAGSFGGKCDANPVLKSTLPCDANVASIMIWDGRIQKLCGCGGVDGEFAAPGTPLSCTFALTEGKTVHFFYQGPFLRHQIVPVGTPAISPGSVFDPNSKVPSRAHAFEPNAAGTYQFTDEFDHTITGSIVVTP